MRPACLIAAMVAFAGIALSAAPPELEAEIARLDAAVLDPDRKLVVVGLMAERLKVHRNRLVLVRKQSGESYTRIFITGLEKAGVPKSQIPGEVRLLNTAIDLKLAGERARPAPLLLVSSAVDHSSAGTFYTLTPEVGVDAGHLAAVIGVPFYRNSALQFSAGGVGDVYAAGYLRRESGRFDFGSSLTVGFPTGDRSRGLGAGIVTADGAGSLGIRLATARLFASGGYTNSVFANVGYQRPYITDGPSAHFSGGIEAQAHRRLRLGLGGFAVRPQGPQRVHSRLTAPQSPAQSASPANSPPAGNWPDPWPNPWQQPLTKPGERTGPLRERLRSLGLLEQVQWIEAPAEDLRDHGLNAWASIALFPGVSFDTAVARSVPFRLTTVRAGLVFDVGNWISRARAAH